MELLIVSPHPYVGALGRFSLFSVSMNIDIDVIYIERETTSQKRAIDSLLYGSDENLALK